MAELIGAVSASLHLAQNIVTYFNGFHDAPRHAADLKEELDAVSQVLGLLHEFLLGRSQAGSSVRFDRTCVLFSAASGCQRRLKAVDDALAPLLATNTNRVARLWRRVTWPLARQETIESVRAIHCYAQVFHFATSVEGLSALSLSQHDALDRIEARLQSMDSDSRDQTPQVLQEISDAVRDLPGLSSQLRSLTESLSGIVIDNHLSQLLGSIPTLEFQDRHRNLQLTRMEGASQWILGMEKFVDWRDGPSTNGALWCNGAPGAGKTYLASVVIDHLMEVCSQDRNSAGVLYFYFDYKKQSDQSPLKFLQTLLHQLLSMHSHIPPEAEEMFDNIRRGKGLPSWKDMKTIFINLCNNSTMRLFIIFDALDECDASANRGPVVELINDIKKSHARLVVTSRPYPPDIDRLFGDCPQILVEASDSDIRAFVLDQIAHSDQMSTIIGQNLREKIVTSILAKSQGMFLLPALQINNILGQTSKREIEEALETLPTGLADNLAMTIERIKSQHAQSQTRARLALSVLQWLSTVQRQITASELQHAIAVSRLGKNERNLDLGDLTKPTFFVDCCFGLVVIDRETSIIRLVHFSVNEYLQEQRRILFDNPDGDVAACCLAYITACATSLRRRAATVTFDELNSKWALWEYATCHWGVHARTCTDQRVMDKLAGFFSVSTAMELWSRHLADAPGISRYRREDDAEWLVAARFVAKKTTALHIAAVYGIYGLAVDCLAKDPTAINTKDDAGATPLMLAAGSGSKAVLELLISRNAIDLNAQDKQEETALLYAIRSTQLEMVQLLLAQSPQLDVNAGNVINIACEKCRDAQSPDGSAIIALLLEHPAFDLVAQSAFASSDEVAWATLAMNSEFDGLRSLLARSDFDAWRRFWPLARRRRDDCMNYLINTDHDVGAWGTKSLVNTPGIALFLDKAFPECDDFMPLQAAWPMVYYAFGPYVTENKEESSAIYIKIPCSSIWDDAAETGREELREALELHGISLDSTDSKGKGFLHFIAYLFATDSQYEDEENLKHLQFLLDRGGPIDVRDHKGRTPLHFAAKEGGEDVVRLLIKAGADPLASDHEGLTALHYATQSNNLGLVKLLLENGAYMAATTKQGDSILHFAAQSGKTQTIIAFLIGKGASLALKNIFGETPIMSSMWGELEALKTLLEFGADPLETSPSYVCALTRAVFDMDVERTKVCLAKVKKNEDLSGPRFFGMSILDFLSQFDPAIATEIGFNPEHWAVYVPTPPEKRRLNAIEAIGVRLKWMMEGDDDIAEMLAYFTGYLLLQAGDDDAARIMFEQSMEPKSKHLSSPYYEYGCNNCYTQFTPHFQCRVCPRVGFCQSCLGKAPADRDAKKCDRPGLKCTGHGFLRIGGEQWKSLPEGKVNKEGQTFREFLKELQCRYVVIVEK